MKLKKWFGKYISKLGKIAEGMVMGLTK